MLDPVRAKAKIIGLAAATFFGGVMLASGMEWTAGSQAATLLQTLPAPKDVRPVAELSEAFVSISESVTPAVVNIQVERARRSRVRGENPEMQIPEPFRRFFEGPQGPGGSAPPMQGSGSGFLISQDGYIMTNNHVVEDADEIIVKLKDRREFRATVIGKDPNTDVAVIKIEGNRFPHVRLGQPEDTRVGEWVLAIGNPLGNLEFTVTAGIVSAKGRPLPIIRQSTGSLYAIESFIQTDAAINPGNSGGPLVNIRGEVIGVNSAIASNTGYNEGYGFAVPIDIAKRVADDLVRYGRVKRPILGVSIAEVSVEDAEYYRLPSVSGVLVQDFSIPNGPAERAGLKQGDVIVGVNGDQVAQVNELQRRIAGLSPGDRVTLDVIRSGKRERVQVQLTEAPAPRAEEEPVVAAREPATEGRLGLRVAPMTAELAAEMRFREPGGLAIVDVQPFGAAGRKNITGGQFKIIAADGQRISTQEDFERILRGKKAGEVISLTLEDREGTSVIRNIRVPR